MELVGVLFDWCEKHWHSPRAAWLAPLGAATLVLLLQTEFFAKSVGARNVAIASATALLVAFVWVATNRVPRVPKKRNGIVVAIAADNDEQALQIRKDFLEHMSALVATDEASTHLQILVIPKYLAERLSREDQAIALLHKTRGIFMLWGRARKRRIGGADSHLLELRGIVRHRPVSPHAHAQLKSEFNSTLPTTIQFPVNNDVFAFAFTSEWAEIVARYMIGLAAMVSGYLPYAELLLLKVEERLAGSSLTGPMRKLKYRVPERVVELYTIWVNALHDVYWMKRERSALVAAEPVVEKLLARAPKSYGALLYLAICRFVLHRDVAGAKAAIAKCTMNPDATWRYSRAFLLAYEGRMTEARAEYKLACRAKNQNETVRIQSEEFIQLVLQEEPQKAQLHFASALINEYAKRDFEGARRDYSAFLAHQGSTAFPDERVLAEEALGRL